MSTASYQFSWQNICTEFWDKQRLSLSNVTLPHKGSKKRRYDFLNIFLRCWICPEHAVHRGTMQRNAKWARPPTDSPDQICVLNFETNDVCLCLKIQYKKRRYDMIFWRSFYSVESVLNMLCAGVPCNVMRSEHGLLPILLTKYLYWILRQTTFVFVKWHPSAYFDQLRTVHSAPARHR